MESDNRNVASYRPLARSPCRWRTGPIVDGVHVGSSRQKVSVPTPFSYDETLDVGVDFGRLVSDDHTPDSSRFSRTVNWAQLDQHSDDSSHLTRPGDRLSVAMAMAMAMAKQ